MAKMNICITGLSKQFVDEIAYDISVKLDMYYANVEKIIDFELIDLLKMEALCGGDYLKKKETSIIKRICSYENTLINLDYSNFNNEEIHNIVNDSCLIVYIRLEKDEYLKELNKVVVSKSANLINMDLFEDRDALCKQVADITVNCDNPENTEEFACNLLQKIYDYYD